MTMQSELRRQGGFSMWPSGKPPRAPDWFFSDPLVVGHMPLGTTTYDEISGLAPCRASANLGHLIGVDDSANYAVFIRTSDMAARGQLTLTGETLNETEDADVVIKNGVSYVWLACTGDNSAARTTVIVYRFPEPTITGSNVAVGTFDKITCDYPASPAGEGGTARRDAESAFADALTGDLYIITKRTTVPQLFRLPWATTYTGTQTLQFVCNLPALPIVTFSGTGTSTGHVVGASASSDGLAVLVRGYSNAWMFTRKRNETVATMMQRTPREVPLPHGPGPTTNWLISPKGESICFAYNDASYFLCDEFITGSGQTIYTMPVYECKRSLKPLRVVHRTNGVDSATVTSSFIDQNVPAGSNFNQVYIDIDQGPAARCSFLRATSLGLSAGETCVAAYLTFHNLVDGTTATPGGSGTTVHRMLLDWYTGASMTWNTNAWGVAGPPPKDNVACVTTPEGSIGAGTAATNVPNGYWKLTVSESTINAWQGGATNHGWVFQYQSPTGSDGMNPKGSGYATVNVPQSTWDAASLGQADGTAVVTWVDSTGARSASQGSAGNRPTQELNEINGRAVIRFDPALGQYLTADSIATAGLMAADHYIGFVIKPGAISYTGGPGGRVICSSHPAGSATNGNIYYISGATGYLHCLRPAGDVVLIAQDLRSRWSIVILNIEPQGRISAFLDGEFKSSQAQAHTASQTLFSIGQEWDSGVAGDFFEGDLAAINVGSRALTTLERQQLTGYWAHRYALTANLSNAHPWKLTAPVMPSVYQTSRPRLTLNVG